MTNATKDFFYEEVVSDIAEKEPASLAKDLNSDLDAPSAFASPPFLQTEQGSVSLQPSCFLFYIMPSLNLPIIITLRRDLIEPTLEPSPQKHISMDE